MPTAIRSLTGIPMINRPSAARLAGCFTSLMCANFPAGKMKLLFSRNDIAMIEHVNDHHGREGVIRYRRMRAYDPGVFARPRPIPALGRLHLLRCNSPNHQHSVLKLLSPSPSVIGRKADLQNRGLRNAQGTRSGATPLHQYGGSNPINGVTAVRVSGGQCLSQRAASRCPVAP
jgi:hypothetical protein